jgi:molybdopterin converting factor small subunit
MIIQIFLFSSLRRYVPRSERRLDKNRWKVDEGTTAARIVEMLEIPEEMAAILLVNGRRADMERVLHEGDVLAVFPPMVGG